MRKKWKGYEKMVTAPLLLENLMDEKDYKQHHIAKPAGVSVATLSNFLQGKRSLNFGAALLIQKLFFGEDKTFLREVCKSYEKPEHIKPAMEFLSINHFNEDLIHLIDKAKSCRGLDEWCTTYSILLCYQNKTASRDSLLIKIRSVYHEISTPELRALLHTVEANIHDLEREYKALFRTADLIKHLSEEVSDSYVRKSLTMRLNEILSRAHLYSNKGQEDARKYANLVFSSNLSAKFNAYAYYIIGTSYMFQDFAKSRHHLEESARMYEESGFLVYSDMIRNQNIKMLETYWKKNLDVLDENMDKSEKAYRLAVRGDKAEAIEILENMEETNFRVYYMAIAKNDYSLHFKALLKFIEEGDFLYAQLPYRQIRESEEHGWMVEHIYKEWGD